MFCWRAAVRRSGSVSRTGESLSRLSAALRSGEITSAVMGLLLRGCRGLGGLGEDRPHEAVARADGGEDPRPEAAPLAEEIRREERHPAGIQLDLLAGAAVGDGYARRGAAEAQFGDGEAVQRRVRDLDALPREEPARLREPHALRQQPPDRGALLFAAGPRLAARSLGRRAQRHEDGG